MHIYIYAHFPVDDLEMYERLNRSSYQSFPGVLELLNKNKSMDFKDIKDFAQADYWSRDKVSGRLRKTES